MSDLRTERLVLHPVDIAEARRIVAGEPDPSDSWASDYPFDGDLRALTAFLAASEALGEQRPFGYYRIDVGGVAVGGIGFKGPPVDAVVEVGYGLAPSARGHGYAAEAVAALVELAQRLGVARVVADTTTDNVASQRTLERAGFGKVGATDVLVDYSLDLAPGA